MSLAVKLMCLILMLGLGGLFVLKKPNGQPWLSVSDFMPDTDKLQRVLNAASEGDTESLKNAGKTQVYRWQDKNGNWQFSDKTPELMGDAGSEAESLWIDPDRNLIQGLPAEEKLGDSGGEGAGVAEPLGLPLPFTVSPDKIPKLMDDAKNVQKLLDQRSADLEKY